jgi:hypothetical protein
MSRYYSKSFTEKELKELIAFLRRPQARSSSPKLPDTIQHAADLSGVIMETNRKNLEDILKRKGAGAKR